MYSFLLVKVDSLTRHLTEHRWRIVKVRKDRVRDEHLSGDCFRHQAHVMSWTPSSEEGIWLEATSPLWISHFPTSKSLSPECQCVHRSRLSRFPTFWDKLPIVRVQPWVNLPPLSLSREPNTWPVLLWKKEKRKNLKKRVSLESIKDFQSQCSSQFVQSLQWLIRWEQLWNKNVVHIYWQD